MLVVELGDGRLWCIPQPSHTLQSAAFAVPFGNREFAPARAPLVFGAAVAQHDNGWVEIEAEPEITDTGAPTDFLSGPAWPERLAMWWRGIDRCFAQHPYAGLLVARHGALLYRKVLATLDGDEAAATQGFLDAQPEVLERARNLLGGVPAWREALADGPLDAATALLAFCDLASLRLCLGWSHVTSLADCPVDEHGTTVALRVEVDGDEVALDPWPFAVDAFEAPVWGRVLDRGRFGSSVEYRAALSEAPVLERRWRVVNARTGA